MKCNTRPNGNWQSAIWTESSNLLRNVRAALRRIDEGAFGVCLHCEEDISPKRLAAVPWTAYCIRCQEVADRNQAGDGSESFDELLVSAA